MLNNLPRDNIHNFVEETKSDYGNVTPRILDLTQRELTKIPNHPLRTLGNKCKEFYTSDSIKKSE